MEKIHYSKTQCMKAIVGIPNEVKIPGLNKLNSILIDCVKEVERKTGIYLSIETHLTSVHYKSEWGCPDEIHGEDCICIETLRNVKFNSNEDLWKNACLELMKEIKRKLNQSTISMQFFDIDMTYLYTENE